MKILRYDPGAGKRYEDVYGGWLKLFQEVAESPNGTVEVVEAPSEWNPLLWYLGEDMLSYTLTRDEVEAACAVHPVLVDALWRADMLWHGKDPHSGLRRHVWETEFLIATYSGLWRPEVMCYINNTLPAWKPRHTRCVLVPCAADKPYPSPLHKAVREVVGEDCHIIVATGVLGLVPDDLWGQMPYYDAGLPYPERLQRMTTEFFTKHTEWTQITVYSDFNARDLYHGLGSAGLFADYILGSGRRYEYENLLDPKWLAKLARSVQ